MCLSREPVWRCRVWLTAVHAQAHICWAAGKYREAVGVFLTASARLFAPEEWADEAMHIQVMIATLHLLTCWRMVAPTCWAHTEATLRVDPLVSSDLSNFGCCCCRGIWRSCAPGQPVRCPSLAALRPARRSALDWMNSWGCCS